MLCIKCNAELPEGAAFCHICGKKQAAGEKKRGSRTRGNGTGSVYRTGKTWTCSVVLGYVVQPDGKRKAIRPKKGGFKTKKEALEYLPKLKEERPRLTPTLAQLHDRYLESQKYTALSASRKDKYRIAWKRLERLWFVKIDLLTTFDLQAAVNSAASTYYPARDVRDLLSLLYQMAMPDQFVKTNLADFIELPPLNAKEQEAFTKEEIMQLWSDYADGNWWTGYILLMIYTGMMPGELMGCHKAAIDWNGKQIVGEGIKTEERKKTPIVLADEILPVLADLCERVAGDKLIRINKDNFYEVYYKTLERAGCRRLVPYTCRHTAATTLALENIAPSVLQKIMRHAKFSTTEKYIHVSIDPMLDAINKRNLRSQEGAGQ